MLHIKKFWTEIQTQDIPNNKWLIKSQHCDLLQIGVLLVGIYTGCFNFKTRDLKGS
jgi:hypothetical protein